MSKTLMEVGEIAAGAALITAGVLTGMNPYLITMGVSLAISGTSGLVISALNPIDTSVPGVMQNQQDSASYRRVIYGFLEVAGVLTFDTMPSGNNAWQNVNPKQQWRHQIYTVAGHQITSFGRGGHTLVVIDGIPTELSLR